MSGHDAALPGGLVGEPREQRQDRGNGSSLPLRFAAGKRRAPAKIERVLNALLEGPKTTRELELDPTFDHVAHSTASDLRRLGVRIVAERIEIRGYGGAPCWIARYSIATEDRSFALELLQKMRVRRGVG